MWMEGPWCGIEGVVWMEGGVGCGWMAGGGVDGCGVGVDGGAVVWDEVYGGVVLPHTRTRGNAETSYPVLPRILDAMSTVETSG